MIFNIFILEVCCFDIISLLQNLKSRKYSYCIPGYISKVSILSLSCFVVLIKWAPTKTHKSIQKKKSNALHLLIFRTWIVKTAVFHNGRRKGKETGGKLRFTPALNNIFMKNSKVFANLLNRVICYEVPTKVFLKS